MLTILMLFIAIFLVFVSFVVELLELQNMYWIEDNTISYLITYLIYRFVKNKTEQDENKNIVNSVPIQFV